jgi:hypothetical protein
VRAFDDGDHRHLVWAQLVNSNTLGRYIVYYIG